MLMKLTPVVNFITLYVQIFCTNVVFSSYLYVEKTMFVQKICTYNVDEIDAWSQFHQQFMQSFYIPNPKSSKT